MFKALTLFFVVVMSSASMAQSKDFSEELDQDRRAILQALFQVDESAKSIYEVERKLSDSWFVGDSNDKKLDYFGNRLPRKGTTYTYHFRKCEPVKLESSVTYFVHESNQDYVHTIDSLDSLGEDIPPELELKIDSVITDYICQQSQDSLNYYYIGRTTKGKDKWYLFNSSFFAEIVVKIRLKDKRFLSKRGVDLDEAIWRRLAFSFSNIGVDSKTTKIYYRTSEQKHWLDCEEE